MYADTALRRKRGPTPVVEMRGMADAVSPPPAPSDGTNPVLIVGGTVLVVALLTVLIYTVGGPTVPSDAAAAGPAAKLAAPAAAGACGQGTPADSSYSVDYATDPDPPRPDGSTVRLTVRHEGRPVVGARVCITADMPDMEHPALNKASSELSAGRYEARIQFGMGGSWRMSVTIAEPDKPAVSVPLTIQVAQVDP
jgi:hypothetical protein